MNLAPTSPSCACARHDDGSVTETLCPLHADSDPCATISAVTGRRRKGTIRSGTCTTCGWRDEPAVAPCGGTFDTADLDPADPGN